MSSECSMPTLIRIVSGRTPALSCSAGVIWRRVVESLGAVEPADDAEGEKRRCASGKIFLGHRVMGARLETRVVDPFDAPVSGEELGDAPTVLDMPLHAQRQRLDALQQEERAHR